jgi:hypothetical protein
MNNEITRPLADKRKISSRNEFELCYMRHQYFRRSTYNPSAEEMAPYMAIVKKRCKHTFFIHAGLFQMVGFENEDLINIGMIHLVSFLGLFSMEMMPEKYASYVEKFMLEKVDPPSEEDVMSKNRANFTIFLKQRLEEVVRVCRQKVRNIKGIPFEEFQPFYGPKKPPMDIIQLMENHESLGFRKMDIAVFKTIRRRAKAYGKNAFRHEKNWYIIVPLKHKNLGMSDFSGAGLDPRDNIHNMNPEEILFRCEDENKWDRKRAAYKSKSKNEKAALISEFIDKNKSSRIFADELKTAKRTLLRMMGPWIEKI